MSIYLGNLRLKDVFKNECVKDIKDYLENNGFKRVNNTSEIEKKKGNYHIFDIPRIIQVCGKKKTRELSDFLVELEKDYENIVKEGVLRIGMTGNSN